MMEAVLSAAAREELGPLRDNTREDTTFRRSRGPNQHHRFEHGLVAETARGPVAFAYRDARVYREHSVTLSRQHALVTICRFERSDGQVWRTTQGNNGPLGKAYEHLLRARCSWHRAAAAQSLAEAPPSPSAPSNSTAGR